VPAGTGALQVGDGLVTVPLTNAPVTPGAWRLFVQLATAEGRRRFLPAPQTLVIAPSATPSTLDLVAVSESQWQLGINGAAGQTLVAEFAEQPGQWAAFATQTLATARWEITVTNRGAAGFFRARRLP
jgi:hypothetical protein